jgi:hypothetical protein
MFSCLGAFSQTQTVYKFDILKGIEGERARERQQKRERGRERKREITKVRRAVHGGSSSPIHPRLLKGVLKQEFPPPHRK